MTTNYPSPLINSSKSASTSSPSFFFRSNKHNRLVYKVWCDSDRTETLIGLWHTHPEPVPTPSGVDFEDWRKTLFHGDYVGDFLVFMIIGTQQIRVWRGDRNAQFHELIKARHCPSANDKKAVSSTLSDIVAPSCIERVAYISELPLPIISPKTQESI